MKRILSTLALLACFVINSHAADLRWGDLGDGTFANPILAGDFSDPDVIRVGNKYYMTCSEFHFMGMPILESDDMVNWKVIARVHDKLPTGNGYNDMNAYGNGTWAPSIRYHDGKFYIYVCSPNEGLWVTTAENPAGPWSDIKLIKAVGGWEDPCPIWDNEGNAYLGRSQLGGGPIYIHRMSPDGMSLLDNGRVVYEGPTAEGTKIFIKDGEFYISIPEGGVSTGWQTVMHAASIYGPYHSKRVFEQGSTDINGPHQGALVDTPDGEWWFYHFQSFNTLGRIVHLQPVVWENGFPVIGTDYDGNGIGEPMKIVTKPDTGVNNTPYAPQSSDDFTSSTLNCYWQFNHNPVLECYDLTSRPGWLQWKPLKAEKLEKARNSLTQKIMGYSGKVYAVIDVTKIAPGQRAGVLCMGNQYYGAGVRNDNGTLRIYSEWGGAVTNAYKLTTQTLVYIRLDLDAANNSYRFLWSTNGTNFVRMGDQQLKQSEANWKGPRVGLYNYSTTDEGLNGTAAFDYFHYEYDGPWNEEKSGIDSVDTIVCNDEISIERYPGGVIVKGTPGEDVQVFNTEGKLLVDSMTNQPMNLSAGLYIVRTADQSLKFALN